MFIIGISSKDGEKQRERAFKKVELTGLTDWT